MERTPRPEMGLERGRRQSVTRVSTSPFPQVHKQLYFSITTRKQYLLQTTVPLLCCAIFACMCVLSES